MWSWRQAQSPGVDSRLAGDRCWPSPPPLGVGLAFVCCFFVFALICFVSAVIVICFVFALKTGLGWKRRKETPVGFTGGPSKSKELFKGKVPKPFWHSGHLGLWRSFWGCINYTQII